MIKEITTHFLPTFMPEEPKKTDNLFLLINFLHHFHYIEEIAKRKYYEKIINPYLHSVT